MKITFWKLFFLAGLICVAVYLWNPLGTATLDPRSRVYGVTTLLASSISMSPTIEKGEYILIESFSYARAYPNTGDIIAFKRPNKDVLYVKRVMAKPGDRIKMDKGIVSLNGKALSESYIKGDPDAKTIEDFPETVIPDNMFFVLGDNRGESLDSRHFGLVERGSIVGKVFFVWMSDKFNRVGKI